MAPLVSSAVASGAGVGNQELALIVKLRGYGMRCGEQLGNGTGDQELETSANCDWELAMVTRCCGELCHGEMKNR